MAMRMSGMISGMDTESLISQLVDARKSKVDKVKKAQIKQNWKQDAWKDLNTKIKNLQSKYISNMRFASSYSKKTTKVSDSSKASVITGDGAVNSVQSLEIEELAKTAYLTGGKVTNSSGGEGNYTALTTMADLGFSGSGNIELQKGGTTTRIAFDGSTSISDLLNEFKNQGLNATFDENNQRFFISSKDSGASNDFKIRATGANSSKALSALGLLDADGVEDAKTRFNAGTLMKGNAATKVEGKDAKIKLNGAEFTNSTNVFEINGLTITALAKTEANSPITLTTDRDTDGIYDMVKNFLKEYNTLINEMDKLYNAESAKGYEPLLTEEKDAMSDSEAEEYEKKIKSALLKGDSNLSSISSALKEAMSSGFDVNGTKRYLTDFGINTLGYFTAADNEKNAYHIDGDPDDDNTSGNADKLKSLISSDPDMVISFFTQLSQNIYDKMADLSKSVDGYRSFGNFYDDKKMASDYKDYTSKISEQEQKLNDYEDKWYKKFAKMESAMAKMQSKTNALAGLVGGS